MTKAYLLYLKIFDSKDSFYPLNYEKVCELKRSILLEFLKIQADQYIAVELFGDLAVPSDVHKILSLVPDSSKFKISQVDSNMRNIVSEYLLDETINFSESSNPVETKQPVFVINKDGVFETVRSSFYGCVPLELLEPTDLQQGYTGYIARFVTKKEAQTAALFKNETVFICSDTSDTMLRKIAEKFDVQSICCFLMLSSVSRGEKI